MVTRAHLEGLHEDTDNKVVQDQVEADEVGTAEFRDADEPPEGREGARGSTQEGHHFQLGRLETRAGEIIRHAAQVDIEVDRYM